MTLQIYCWSPDGSQKPEMLIFENITGNPMSTISSLCPVEQHTRQDCETRPGPEYVIRSYTFDSDGKYFLIQHRYWDDSCSSPQLTILSYGRIQLRNSLIQPGAADGQTRLTNITIIPQDNNAAKELDRMVAMECPGRHHHPFLPSTGLVFVTNLHFI
ncbi:hypothetical protein NQ317_015257 [Molorchus minor]|uniref:APCDD1 domain-containing protein n=1 Tax=Molorchus minor TaxID=1323400 RepID=A0ABQ9IWU3_9CUCU|nr:hypothetical protein NQ317_015257 [Molorchus minor]